MISVIISSANKNMLANISQNIAHTIGVPFEIIGIDNSMGIKGICAVYNQGTVQAIYNVLCFVHEDIVFRTNNWGKLVIKIFSENNDLGLLGVAGSTYKTLTPSGWHGSGIPTDHLNILQTYKYKSSEPKLYYRNPKNEKLTQVACVDGVWLCTTKKVLEKVNFDGNTFKGFHAYDLDFSMAVSQHYKVAVTYNVLLHHLSEGNFSKDWFFEMLKFQKKWNKQLPVCTEVLLKKHKLYIEKMTFRTFVEQLITMKLPANIAYKELWRNGRFIQVYPSLFFKLQLFIYKAYKAAKKENRL